ncbi:hypothetical protein HNQ57_003218 [Zhongshania antarctica]|uniref:Uncharacterized protein n=1 Tax=Zhongshania antarctica TaxID=641702 RepID=A0A840R9C6_9GAMM|nr:hypothetical protein [Zhongshania antarctica]MBB5188921.1 hypothetical protein [Zhongshania antarctica]
MSKLLKLKPWLTLTEAASYASSIISEKVKTSDLLQFALEGHLTLSVNLVNHATAVLGNSVLPSEVTYKDVIVPAIMSNKESTLRIFDGKFISENEAVVFEKNVKSINGIWDLSMHGCERLDVEYEYLRLTKGPELTLFDVDGDVILYRPEDKIWANLKEHLADNPFNKNSDYPVDENYRNYENFYPAGGLPKDCVWGVKPPNLMDFIQSLSEPLDKPKATAQKNRKRIPRHYKRPIRSPY